MMSFITLLLGMSTSAFAVTTTPSPGLAGAPDGFGLGVVLGDPSGLSFAWRSGDRGLIQGAVGWSAITDRLELNGDYLLNAVIFDSEATPRVRWPLYVGLGGRLRLGDADKRGDDSVLGLGARVPVGITCLPRDLRLDAFLELVPILDLYPETIVRLDAGIGGRIYF